MKPKNIHKYYSDFLEGNLEEPERKRFLEILRLDPERHADYALFVKSQDLLANLPQEEAGPEFERQVLSRLHRSQEKPVGRSLPVFLLQWKPITGAAALLLLLISPFLVNRLKQEAPLPTSIVDAGVNLERGAPSQYLRNLPPSLKDPVFTDRLTEVTSLIQEIDRLNSRYRQRPKEIYLGQAKGQEFVFRPQEFYRKALQKAARQESSDSSLRRAY